MEEVKKWIKKAERDLNAAKINLQQVVENSRFRKIVHSS